MKFHELSPERQLRELEKKRLRDLGRGMDAISSDEGRKVSARKSLTNYAQHLSPVLKEPYQPFHHSNILCDYLTRFAFGGILRLMINVRPQAGKSLHSSNLLPSFIHGHNPDAPILIISYGDDLASDFCKGTREIMETERYAELFPNSWLKQQTEGRSRSTANLFEIPNHAGLLETTGVSGSVTGKGFEFIIVDDLIKNSKEAQSSTWRDTTADYYTSTIRSRRRSERTPILMLNTRWDEDDINGRQIALAKVDPNADQWTVLNLPELLSDCENPEEERWKFPPGQEPGKEVLWPERFSYKDVLATKAADPFFFTAMHMGSPVAREGNAVRRDWYILTPVLDITAIVSIHLYYDMGFSDSPEADWTWGSLKAKLSDNSFITLWQHFGKWNSNKRNTELTNFGLTLKKITEDGLLPPVPITVEAGIGGSVEVVKDCRNALLAAGLNCVASPSKGNKVARATGMQDAYLSACQALRVKFYTGPLFKDYGLWQGTERWINPYLNEVTKLRYNDAGDEFIGGKDDMLDAETGAHNKLTTVKKVWSNIPSIIVPKQ